MPTKQSQLQALADLVELLIELEIPHDFKWNEIRTQFKTAVPLIGGWLDTDEAAAAALTTLFDVDHDPVTGKNLPPPEWVIDAAVPAYLSAAQLRLTGDRRPDYVTGHRVQVKIAAALVVLALSNVAYDGVANATILTVSPAILANTLNQIARGIARFSVPQVSRNDIIAKAVDANAIDDKQILERTLGDNAVSRRAGAVGLAYNVEPVRTALGGNLSFQGGEQDFLVTAPIVIAGGVVSIATEWAAMVYANPNTVVGAVTVRLKRRTAALPAYTTLETWQHVWQGGAVNDGGAFPLPDRRWFDVALQATTYIYKFTIQVDAGLAVLTAPPGNAGGVFVSESR